MAASLRITRNAILTGHGLDEAESKVKEASQWAQHVAEPFFLMAILCLLQGDPPSAAQVIWRRMESLNMLDPVEIAWLMLISRLVGHTALEATMREQAGGARHLCLRRVLWLLDDGCAGDATPDGGLLKRQPDDHLSVHWLGEEDFTQWCDLVRRVLMANRASPGAGSVSQRLLAAA